MGYKVTWRKVDDDQVIGDRYFDDLNAATAEAERGLNLPFRVGVVVEDDDGNICHRAYTGRV
jgi:hypothetical protein